GRPFLIVRATGSRPSLQSFLCLFVEANRNQQNGCGPLPTLDERALNQVSEARSAGVWFPAPDFQCLQVKVHFFVFMMYGFRVWMDNLPTGRGPIAYWNNRVTTLPFPETSSDL
ncbi:MAG: hypothetical protein QNI94_17305, partial [Kiloniellales bacterium]|nr:hypothetical protein [Kiloniellales bacterium]